MGVGPSWSCLLAQEISSPPTSHLAPFNLSRSGHPRESYRPVVLPIGHTEHPRRVHDWSSVAPAGRRCWLAVRGFGRLLWDSRLVNSGAQRQLQTIIAQVGKVHQGGQFPVTCNPAEGKCVQVLVNKTKILIWCPLPVLVRTPPHNSLSINPFCRILTGPVILSLLLVTRLLHSLLGPVY